MMEYKGYYADVKYSDEDKLFIGEVMGLNDTLAFHGSSVSELEAMFRQSVDNYLETCQEYGKKPEPATTQLQLSWRQSSLLQK